MKKKMVLAILCCILLCLSACANKNEEASLDINQYERIEDIVSIEKLDLERTSSGGVEVSTYKVKYKVDDCTVVSYLSVPNKLIHA